MALSGTLNSSAYGDRYLQVTWSATQSVADNTSTVSWSLKGAGGGSEYYYVGNITLTIAGSVVYSCDNSNRFPLRNGTEVASGKKTITHSSDGSKKITISVEAGLYTYAVNVSGSKEFTLDTIARATTPTLSASSCNVGSAVTINMSRASSAFTHTLTYKIGSASGTIGTSLGTSKSWTVPTSLADQIIKGSSGSCTISCTTFYGSTSIGSKTVTLTVNVPDTDTYKPSVSVTHSEVVSLVKSTFNSYVKELSKISVKITASGKNGATISRYSTAINGTTYTDAEFTTDLLKSSGSETIEVKVTDSREHTTTVSIPITVADYSKPAISSFQVIRCDSSGTADEDGSYAKVTLVAGVTNLTGNTATYSIKYKKHSDTNYTDSGYSSTALSVNTSKIISGISPDYAYDFYGSVADPFDKAEIYSEIGTGFTLVDYSASGKGIAFGKVSEADGMDVNLEAVFKKKVTLSSFNGFEYSSDSDVDGDESNLEEYLDECLASMPIKTSAPMLIYTPGIGSAYSYTGNLVKRSDKNAFFLGYAYSGHTLFKVYSNNEWSPANLMLNANNEVDRVVESGTSGIWTYRKWQSGIAECWGTQSVTVTGGTLWATPIYYSKEGTGQINYPFTFKARPEEIVAISYASTNACWIYKESGTSGQNTTTKTANYKAIKVNNFDSASYTIVFSFSVKGRWK